MSKTMLYWFFFLCVQAVGYTLAAEFGYLNMAVAADISRLTYFIILLHVYASAVIGYAIHQLQFSVGEPNLKRAWFLAELPMSIGMIGTLVGFIYMIYASIGVLPAEITTTMLRDTVKGLALGMGTALWTTLFGLAVSTLLKIQCMLLESAVDKKNV